MCHCYWHGDDKCAIAIDRVDDTVEKLGRVLKLGQDPLPNGKYSCPTSTSMVSRRVFYYCRTYYKAVRVGLRPELFPGIGFLPGPATESHILNRGTQ